METGARGERGRVTYTRRGRSDRSQAGVEIADHKVSLGARSAKLGIYKRAVCVVVSRLQNRKTRHVVDANVICRSRSKRHACEQKKREWRERDEEEKERHARKERSSCYCYRTGDNCAEGTKMRERERERERETSVARTRLNFSTMPHLPGCWSKTDATLSAKDVKPSRRGEKCVFPNGGIAKRLRVSSYVVCQPRFALEPCERAEKRNHRDDEK